MPRVGFHKDHQNKDVPLSVKLPKSDANDLSRLSKEKKIPGSALIREALRIYLDKEKQSVKTVQKVNIMARIEQADINVNNKMIALIKAAEIPDEADFAVKLLRCQTKDQVNDLVFGRTGDGGWECYSRDQDYEQGWSLDDALNFRNSLILCQKSPELFQEE